MSLSEQDREEIVAYFLRGSDGARLVEKVEQIVARHVAAALNEAAGVLNERRVVAGAQRDAMFLDATRAMFDQQAFAYGDAARIVRTAATPP